MKKYNRALDFTALALNELRQGNGALAAKLMVKAAAQKDCVAAIGILEASNKQAFALQAGSKKRLRASDEFPFEGGDVEAGDDDMMDMDSDPLDEVEAGDDDMMDDEMMTEDEPGVAMARVLSSMTRKARR